MHFRPLYLVIGLLLTVIHAAPFPATDGANNDRNFMSKDLNIRTEPTSKSQPLHSRVFVEVMEWPNHGETRPIPEAIRARIAAHLNGKVEQFIEKPVTPAQIQFSKLNWDSGADPTTTAFAFQWWNYGQGLTKHFVHLNHGEWGVMKTY
ncbi:hypothetical protein F5879DRAFT_590095 [Lentinula edodes]|nr:hypothetical protein F5879DRAFT_590095 [Lentinula edodes]